MKKKLLFLFSVTSEIDLKSAESDRDSIICIEPEECWGEYNRKCSLEKNTEITKEILSTAIKLMQSEAPQCKNILLTQWLAENIEFLPEAISSLIYCDHSSSNEWQLKKCCIEFLKKLPPHVTEINIRTYLRKWKNPGEIIAAVPKNIRSITLNGEILKNCTDEELKKFFSSFHDQIKEIRILGDVSEDYTLEDKKLHNFIIQLPFSVETLLVPRKVSGCWADYNTEKHIKVQEYRKKQYIPNSYLELTGSSPEDLFQKAKNLLSDYTKNTCWAPRLALFATFHWDRHHINQVNNILEQSKSIDELLSNLSQIETEETFNPTGSLARRIHYIRYMQYQKQNLKHEEGIKINP